MCHLWPPRYYVLGLRVVVHIPRVAVAAAGVVEAGARGFVGGGAAEKDGVGVDDGGDPGGVDGGLAQRLSQCAYGPPLWLSDRRPCADSALLHRQALLDFGVVSSYFFAKQRGR